MKDVGFLLALFSRHKDYPAWGYRRGSTPARRRYGAACSGVTMGWSSTACRRTKTLRDAHAPATAGAERQGDLDARWRALSVGMEAQGRQRTLHLLRAKAWYDARFHYLK